MLASGYLQLPVICSNLVKIMTCAKPLLYKSKLIYLLCR